jgi:hypothetical protein
VGDRDLRQFEEGVNMSMVDYQNLHELLVVADVAIRTASELHRVQSGNSIQDSDVLKQAHVFLDRAKRGGDFIADGRQASNYQFDGTLKPLNWAVDAYLSTHRGTEVVDYNDLAQYLDSLNELLDAVRATAQVQNADLEGAIVFFETLSKLLRTRIMGQIRDKNPEEVEIGAIA